MNINKIPYMKIFLILIVASSVYGGIANGYSFVSLVMSVVINTFFWYLVASIISTTIKKMLRQSGGGREKQTPKATKGGKGE